MQEIKVGDTVTYKGATDHGKVVELWQRKRALVDWNDGTPPNWVALHALTVVSSR